MIKSYKINNFWITFLAILSVMAIGFGIFQAITTTQSLNKLRLSTVSDENVYKVQAENGYKQSLYLTCDCLKNMDANLGKVAVSNNKKHQAEMLAKVAICANEVNNQLANLPIEKGDVLSKCEKFANQTQDYATSLVGVIASGNQLTQTDRNALKNLQTVSKNLYNVFQEYANNDSAMFITNGTGAEGIGDLTDALMSAKEDAFEYEKLIYDGPFSDSVEQKQLACGKKISQQNGSKIVAEYFGENTFSHQVNSACPLFVYKTQKGEVTLTADGKVLEYEATQNFEGAKAFDGKKCIEIAQEFCKKLGYDVQGVWVSNAQEYVTYVNCATVIDEVIIYPELVKVAVDTSSGEVVGIEAKAYLINHQQRDISFGDVTAENAQKSLDKCLKVTNVAKSLVELNGKTYFAHEFECTDGANQYYVYVDSHSGEEIQILKVVVNTEGHTVI